MQEVGQLSSPYICLGAAKVYILIFLYNSFTEEFLSYYISDLNRLCLLSK